MFLNLDQSKQVVESKQQSSPNDQTTKDDSIPQKDQGQENKNQVSVWTISKDIWIDSLIQTKTTFNLF